MKDVDSINFTDMSDKVFAHKELWENEAVLQRKKCFGTHYEKTNLKNVTADTEHLNDEQQTKLLALLCKYEFLFDGTLGTWPTDSVDIKLKDDAKQHHAHPYPVPKVHEEVFKKEVARLSKLAVLRKVNRFKWGVPA